MSAEKVKIRCYACGEEKTHTFGPYHSGQETTSRLNGISEGNGNIQSVYNSVDRWVCLNIQCSLKDFYYCTPEKNIGNGRYYIVGTNKLYSYDEAKKLYEGYGTTEDKDIKERYKKENLENYEWFVKDQTKRLDTIINKHITKINGLKKKRNEYEGKLSTINKEIESAELSLEHLHIEKEQRNYLSEKDG